MLLIRGLLAISRHCQHIHIRIYFLLLASSHSPCSRRTYHHDPSPINIFITITVTASITSISDSIHTSLHIISLHAILQDLPLNPNYFTLEFPLFLFRFLYFCLYRLCMLVYMFHRLR
ncbi:hypothetical protein PTI98_007388 [Pleurotus ostreatus]|nr:hypothetical protein PTI98_007388 [Pleurotus ostreatus]